ncbi:hypothetical protein [Desulfobacula sp.]
MTTRLGIYSLLAGIFVGIFKGISQFMGSKNVWLDLTISTIIGKEYAKSVSGLINVVYVKNWLDYFIYDLPFFIILLGLGIILIIISLFMKNV